MTSRRSLLSSASAIVAVSVALPTATWADDPIPVVATFSILGDMVERIGGEHIELTTLVGPNGDAHVYRPTPQDARAVANAEVLFVNGLEFEGWLERLAEAASFSGTEVVATAGIDAIAFDDDHDDHHGDHEDHEDHDEHDEHGHDDHGHSDHDHDEKEDHNDHAGHDHDDHDDHGHDHGGHHGHDHGAFDPHAWQSLDNAIIYANNIAAGLSQADPNNASDYFANRATFVAEIEALKVEIDDLMSAIPADNRTVVTAHDAFGYFAQDYDMTFVAPQGLSTEAEASAAGVAALITQIRDENISAVFVESITDSRLLEQIANETGAAIGGTLYSDALSDASGPASTYLQMYRHNATTLFTALSGN